MDKQLNWNNYPNIRPICLPPGGDIDIFIEKKALVSGWGLKGTGKVTSILQKGEVMVLRPEQCSGPSVYDDQFTASMLCAGVADGSVDACAGDSGGPIGKRNST
jgi:hypothetical protein